MSCSNSTTVCCQQPLVSVCLGQQNYPLGATGATIFGPNPTATAASGVLSNVSGSVGVTFTFRKGSTVVATIDDVLPGQYRSFAVSGFTSISATTTAAGVTADLCMTEFFRPAI